MTSPCKSLPTATQSLEGDWEERDANSSELLYGGSIGAGETRYPKPQNTCSYSMHPWEGQGVEQSV